VDFGASAWLDYETGWAGGTVDVSSTGGMYIYDGDPLAPEIPVADFEANVTAIALGEQVIFTDLSAGTPTSWAWVFQGGSPGTSYIQTPPPVTYSTPGSWDVTLTVSNINGSDTMYKPGYIYVGGVGIGEGSNALVTVYPNPVSDRLYIHGTDPIQEVALLNLVGQEVLVRRTGDLSVVLNLTGLPAGVYNLKIKISDRYLNKKILVN
jgi:PKD repeat protein